MTLAHPTTTEYNADHASLALAHHDPLEAAIAQVPRQETFFFGINQLGQIYAYGDTPATPLRILDEAEGLQFAGILDCRVTPRQTKDGERDYLDLRMLAPVPGVSWVLSLPCHGSRKNDGTISTQWSVRSLLGALVSDDAAGVDLRATAGIVSAKRGTGVAGGHPANFVDLHLDNGFGGDSDFQHVFAESIQGDRNSLEIAVNQVRRALGLDPQFL